MGCLKKLGCLVVVLVVVACVVWFTRDRWLRILPGRGTTAPATTSSTWQPLTPDGARKAKAALDRLRAPNGPAYAIVAPGELAAFIAQELAKSLPRSTDSIEVAAIGDRLYIRGVVKTSELGDKNSLGPLALLLGEREHIQMGGILRILRPGSAELQVKELKFGNLNLPQPLIPRLIRQISRGERPPGMSPDGLPLKTPDYIGDIRVANGQITLYKTRP